MQTATIPFEETDCFSKAFLTYISQSGKLDKFYRVAPEKSQFKELITSRDFSSDKRILLTETLHRQYSAITLNPLVSQNIDSLKNEKTFTITTGHQLNIFTGPLYFIYKIVTVINLCKSLKKAYPDFHFVPVYWMASEDHDFEEISHFHFEGKKVQWNTDQRGAVGRFNPKELQTIASTLPHGAAFFEEAYGKKTLAESARAYVNHLFEDEGLVVVDADDSELKKQLIPVMEDDLFDHHAEKLVLEASNQLEEHGVKPPVHPRNINFFYLNEDLRERIEKTPEGFAVVDSDIQFSEQEVRQLIHKHPEQFSPNVILRPLYQEMILPNLAYVGGPSELVYWLQLKGVFDHFKVPFPALMPRNFALVCSRKVQEKWKKVGLTNRDFFLDSEEAFSKWVQDQSTASLSYQDELANLSALEAEIKRKTAIVDPTLSQHIEALHASFKSRLAKAEKKLLRAEKRKHLEKQNHIENVKEELFPGGTLQERKINFLNFFLEDPEFIEKLKETFDPFHFEMYLLFEE